MRLMPLAAIALLGLATAATLAPPAAALVGNDCVGVQLGTPPGFAVSPQGCVSKVPDLLKPHRPCEPACGDEYE